MTKTATTTATEMMMPRLSDSMGEGTILSRLIEPGADGAADRNRLEVEAGRADMTLQVEGPPVINPRLAAILGVDMTRDVLRRGSDGEIEHATLTPSCDHRIRYGVETAEFFATVRDLPISPLQVAF